MGAPPTFGEIFGSVLWDGDAVLGLPRITITASTDPNGERHSFLLTHPSESDTRGSASHGIRNHQSSTFPQAEERILQLAEEE
jgi:hypothetical protein